MIQAEAVKAVGEELARARFKFSKFHSAHEGYAIILEELEELKKEVFRKQTKRNLDKMRKEAMHVAAMAIRFMTDACEEV